MCRLFIFLMSLIYNVHAQEDLCPKKSEILKAFAGCNFFYPVDMQKLKTIITTKTDADIIFDSPEENYSVLHYAVIFEQISLVQYLLSLKVNTNALDRNHHTPLLRALNNLNDWSKPYNSTSALIKLLIPHTDLSIKGFFFNDTDCCADIEQTCVEHLLNRYNQEIKNEDYSKRYLGYLMDAIKLFIPYSPEAAIFCVKNNLIEIDDQNYKHFIKAEYSDNIAQEFFLKLIKEKKQKNTSPENNTQLVSLENIKTPAINILEYLHARNIGLVKKINLLS